MSHTQTSDARTVRRAVTVAVSAERAFELFTTRLTAWWPPEHHLGTSAMEEAVLEPREGGRWFERGVDGSECQWGQVAVWDRPRRLGLVWQIDTDWQFNAALVTEIDVTFVEDGTGHTVVELTHHLGGFGDKARKMCEVFDSPGAWATTLGGFSAFADAAAPE